MVGWGPENFTAVFDKYFNPNHFIPGQSSETWFDRAHSVVFDYRAETGIVGFLSYLSIFVVFYLDFVRRRLKRAADSGKTEASRVHMLLDGLLVAMPIGYLVQGAALFDVLPIYISIFLFMAFASYLFYFSPEHRGRAAITSASS